MNIEHYENGRQLADKILSNVPDIFLRDAEIYKYGYSPKKSKELESKGFFLKGMTNHEYAIEASSSFKSIFPSCAIDDWNEDISQSLTFYIKEVEKASGITALFVDSSWDNSKKVNTRYSFICGMAIGLNKNVLMIGLPGFKTPFDYKEVMIVPNDKGSLNKKIQSKFSTEVSDPTINQFSPDISINADKHKGKTFEQNENRLNLNNIQEKDNSVQVEEYISNEKKEIILIDINLGNSIAENEELELSEYYIETGQYYRALKSKQAIIVGSKGTGKTACFYKIRDYYRCKNPNNLVCEIKPADYKMERFLESLKLLEENKGYLGHVLENVWKMIVYCSIIEALNREIELRPVYVKLDHEEQKFMQFTSRHIEFINSPFEQKFEKICYWLHDASHDIDNFSKKIHEEFLTEAKLVLQPILSKRERVVILIDNLD